MEQQQIQTGENRNERQLAGSEQIPILETGSEQGPGEKESSIIIKMHVEEKQLQHRGSPTKQLERK